MPRRTTRTRTATFSFGQLNSINIVWDDLHFASVLNDSSIKKKGSNKRKGTLVKTRWSEK